MAEKKIREIDERLEGLLIKGKESDSYKIRDDVFDEATLKTLYKLSKKGAISAMGGSVSTGKEANVFHALGEGDEEYAIKIYRIATSDFKSMQDYLAGDPRFGNIRNDKKSIVFAWTKKELRNLNRSHNAGIRVPKPITSDRNVLIMEFVGRDGIAAPRLKDIKSQLDDVDEVFEKIVEYMVTLYNDANLVHSDLSEFNILYDDGPVLIDMGQAVTLDHPKAEIFLERDVKNIIRFFGKLGVKSDELGILDRIRDKKEN
ncbi:MAG: serine protein kinase RIO [Halobacteriota archaeon]|nr:serine protein kinase RIO [Halobacteriota archaeon]